MGDDCALLTVEDTSVHHGSRDQEDPESTAPLEFTSPASCLRKTILAVNGCVEFVLKFNDSRFSLILSHASTILAQDLAFALSQVIHKPEVI